MTVTAKDTYGNTATGYTGTVQFSDSSGNNTLPANYTFTTNDHGVHTFSSGVALTTAGTNTLAVADTTAGTISGSALVTISPAAATGFTVIAPTAPRRASRSP